MNLLRRLDNSRYGEVTRAWEGKTVACVATGPSLTAAQIARLQRARFDGDVAGVVVVNEAYLLAPWADVLYFADAGKGDWLDWHRDRPEFKAFAGQRCMVDSDRDNLRPSDDPFLLKHMGNVGLSLDPKGICTGSNSGHQALNVAALSRPRRILLLGYDGKKAQDGREHFFGAHPDKTCVPFNAMLQHMKTVPAYARELGVDIINCTPDSAIDCFERGDLESVLPDPAAAVVSA